MPTDSPLPQWALEEALDWLTRRFNHDERDSLELAEALVAAFERGRQSHNGESWVPLERAEAAEARVARLGGIIELLMKDQPWGAFIGALYEDADVKAALAASAAKGGG